MQLDVHVRYKVTFNFAFETFSVLDEGQVVLRSLDGAYKMSQQSRSNRWTVAGF